jgi:hypothetical protein
MRYKVQFEEKVTCKRRTWCIVECDSEEEIQQHCENGDFEFIETEDVDDIDWEFIKLNYVEEDDEG